MGDLIVQHVPRRFKINQERINHKHAIENVIEEDRLEIETFLNSAFGSEYIVDVDVYKTNLEQPEKTKFRARVETVNMTASDGSPIVFIAEPQFIDDMTPSNYELIVNSVKKQLENFYESELRKTSEGQDSSDNRREGRETSVSETDAGGTVLSFNAKAERRDR